MVYRIDVANAAATPPAVGTVGTEGFPAIPSPPGVPPTTIDPYWCYSLCEEIRNVVVAAGITPTKSLVNQLLAAVMALKAPLFGSAANQTSGLSVSTSFSFTALRNMTLNIVAVAGSTANALSISNLPVLSISGGTLTFNNAIGVGALTTVLGQATVLQGATVTLTFSAAQPSSGLALGVGFNFVGIPTS